ncbi:hypothetical protein [Streptomyces sp. NPDC000618]|uniref:hypothetical protein n=1 Tax=Streptomyces sp. NPDC000618 TaxID=3154265 RepID=UPI00331F31D5
MSLGALTARPVRGSGRVVTLRGYDGPGERDITYEPIVVLRYAREHAKLDRPRQQVEEGGIAPPGRQDVSRGAGEPKHSGLSPQAVYGADWS